MENFKNLGLSENTIQALIKKGFTEPTTIQAKVIPLLLQGEKDVVGQSQTGTGKTAAFALPILETIKERSKTVQAIILTPTRELALQVAQEINSLKGDKDIHILAVYGGSPIGPQRHRLEDGVDIVVGTPGRIMDLQKRKSLKLGHVKYAVLDEADEMLNMGFVEDIKSILKHTPEEKSMLLFSATMPKPILKIAKNYMRDYDFIAAEKTKLTLDSIEQIYYDINARDRNEGLKRVIDYYTDFYGIVFCNTKSNVDSLAAQLIKRNYNAAALHGDITQDQRERILQKFKDKTITILVATDVAARGIDVNDLTHVVNYSLPQSPESYVHRIGRTGRAGKKGISITFVIPSEKRKLSFVEKVNKCKLIKQKLPSVKDIIDNKENKIKEIIKNVIKKNKGKKTKYNSMAEELLGKDTAEEVVAAVLKYSFKNELNANSYKDIADAKVSRAIESSDRGRFGRGRSRSFGRSSSRGRSSFGRSEGRSSSRGRSDRSSEGRSERKTYGRSPARDRPSSKGRSERKPYGRSSSEGRSDRSSRKPFSFNKSDRKSSFSRSDKPSFSRSSKGKDRSSKKRSDRKRRDR